jgi:hypothetical protein
VKLYLDGKIQHWYSRGDGRGVVLFLDVKTIEEARAMMDTLPLSKESLMDHKYIPLGPLLPLASLVSGEPQEVRGRNRKKDPDCRHAVHRHRRDTSPVFRASGGRCARD